MGSIFFKALYAYSKLTFLIQNLLFSLFSVFHHLCFGFILSFTQRQWKGSRRIMGKEKHKEAR